MKSITPGHRYELENFEDRSKAGQIIQFIEKTPHPITPGEMITIEDGTTNEDMVAVLIDRMNFLQAKHPCRENAMVITKLDEALLWLEKRTADRAKRGVEGKNLK